MTALHGESVADRWRIGELIGRGAVADVHRGVDAATGDAVAVKLLRHADPSQRVRFAREAQALESLDHPGVVRVLGHGELDGRPFLVLEHVAGGSLADRLATGPLPEQEVADIGAVLAGALEHAHANGIVHRDVKPSNVLLDDAGRPRLADFGVAQLEGADTLTATGFTVGTAGYLAPEQVRGEAVGPATDVYALGLVLLEAATGERAYPGSGVVAAMARLERPPTIPPTVSPALAGLIREMTAMSAASRPAMAAVGAELARLAGGSTDGGTAVLPVVDAPTEVVAVGAAGTAAPVTRRAVRRFPAIDWRPVVIALVCFAAGFLLVAMLRSAVASSGLRLDDLAPATTEAPPPTTAAQTTAPPAPTTQPPPPTVAPDDDGGGNGRGNEGRGNGRGRGGDD